MGDCIYCGKSAGLLKKLHKECEHAHLQGRMAILKTAGNSMFNCPNWTQLENEIRQSANANYIDECALKQLLVTAWANAVTSALDDGILTVEEEKSLVAFKEHFKLSQNDLDQSGAFMKVAKAAVLCQ
jgi:hypothetical protein